MGYRFCNIYLMIYAIVGEIQSHGRQWFISRCQFTLLYLARLVDSCHQRWLAVVSLARGNRDYAHFVYSSCRRQGETRNLPRKESHGHLGSHLEAQHLRDAMVAHGFVYAGEEI